MAIIINGKTCKTLAQPVYANDERVLLVHANGELVYPEDNKTYVTISGIAVETVKYAITGARGRDGKPFTHELGATIGIDYKAVVAFTPIESRSVEWHWNGSNSITVSNSNRFEVVALSSSIMYTMLNEEQFYLITDNMGGTGMGGTSTGFRTLRLLTQLNGARSFGPEKVITVDQNVGTTMSMIYVNAAQVVGSTYPRAWPVSNNPYRQTSAVYSKLSLRYVFGYHLDKVSMDGEQGLYSWTDWAGIKHVEMLGNDDVLLCGMQVSATEAYDRRLQEINPWGAAPPATYGDPKTWGFSSSVFGIMWAE